MKQLTAKECKIFFKFFYPYLLKGGILPALENFCKKQSDAIGEAIASFHMELLKGSSLQAGLLNMRPRFPLYIQNILIIGIETGRLDYIVSDLNNIYAKKLSETELIVGFSKYLSKIQKKSKSNFICIECLRRDLNKIFSRAKIENADKVILKQEGELFLHQYYASSKLIKISEPSHSGFYKTLLKHLTRKEIGPEYIIRKLSKTDFVIKKKSRILYLSFE